MYSFFVLGQIPGTSITISFTAWLTLCLLGGAGYLAVRVYRRRLDSQQPIPTISAE